MTEAKKVPKANYDTDHVSSVAEEHVITPSNETDEDLEKELAGQMQKL